VESKNARRHTGSQVVYFTTVIIFEEARGTKITSRTVVKSGKIEPGELGKVDESRSLPVKLGVLAGLAQVYKFFIETCSLEMDYRFHP